MYAKQRRGRLAGGVGGWVCRCVWWWWWGYDCSRIEEEALLLLYLQLYFVIAVAFLDHSFLVSSIAILSFILNFQLVLRIFRFRPCHFVCSTFRKRNVHSTVFSLHGIARP